MHHLKETTIDGVKFVLIPEALLQETVKVLDQFRYSYSEDAMDNNEDVIAVLDKLEKL